jgi:hypothetical protein
MKEDQEREPRPLELFTTTQLASELQARFDVLIIHGENRRTGKKSSVFHAARGTVVERMGLAAIIQGVLFDYYRNGITNKRMEDEDGCDEAEEQDGE